MIGAIALIPACLLGPCTALLRCIESRCYDALLVFQKPHFFLSSVVIVDERRTNRILSDRPKLVAEPRLSCGWSLNLPLLFRGCDTTHRTGSQTAGLCVIFCQLESTLLTYSRSNDISAFSYALITRSQTPHEACVCAISSL